MISPVLFLLVSAAIIFANGQEADSPKASGSLPRATLLKKRRSRELIVSESDNNGLAGPIFFE
jgi:hypothetical protein